MINIALLLYGRFSTTTRIETTVDESAITDLASLKLAIAQMWEEWASFQGFMASDLLGRSLRAQRVYTAEHLGHIKSLKRVELLRRVELMAVNSIDINAIIRRIDLGTDRNRLSNQTSGRGKCFIDVVR